MTTVGEVTKWYTGQVRGGSGDGVIVVVAEALIVVVVGGVVVSHFFQLLPK